jgi:hypothetical protein
LVSLLFISDAQKTRSDEKDESRDENSSTRDDPVRSRAMKLPKGMELRRTLSVWNYAVKRISGILTGGSGIRVSE